jgi:hypothetical protein
MIILPDKNVVRTKVLMPVPKREWMPPSIAQRKTFCGDEDRVTFSLKARLADGHVVWLGLFEDRDDVDAFLYAVVTGSLNYERELWRMPSPWWDGYGIDNVVFELVVNVTLTTTGTANTYIVPADWGNANNTIQCIGGGASGGIIRKATEPRLATGGGGGGYGKTTNISLTGGASVTYGIGAGGAFVRLSTNGLLSGNSGGDTYFNAASYAAATVGGQGGFGGVSNTTAVVTNGGAGGAGKGSVNYSGGSGGGINFPSAASSQSTGGGGAAGPNGAGNNGNTINSSGDFYSLGGSGDAGFGGATGSGNGGSGGAGTEFGTTGSGAGGNGGTSLTGSSTGGSGGLYGGAGAAASGPGTITSGTGRQGLIYIQYTPTIGVFSFNLAMMGM